jgi:multisubunit Na+/H+ antiporter MnhF subunit
MTPAICLALVLTCIVTCVLTYLVANVLEGTLVEDIAMVVHALSFLGAVTFALWGVWAWALSLS